MDAGIGYINFIFPQDYFEAGGEYFQKETLTSQEMGILEIMKSMFPTIGLPLSRTHGNIFWKVLIPKEDETLP